MYKLKKKLGKSFSLFTIPIKSLNIGETYCYKYRLVMCQEKDKNNFAKVNLITNDQNDCIIVDDKEYLKLFEL